MTSAKTRLMEEQTVFSLFSLFDSFMFINCFKLYRRREKCYLQMLVSDKKSKLFSDAAQNARRLIRACSFFPP